MLFSADFYKLLLLRNAMEAIGHTDDDSSEESLCYTLTWRDMIPHAIAGLWSRQVTQIG